MPPASDAAGAMTSARHFDRRCSHSAPTSSTAQGEPRWGCRATPARWSRRPRSTRPAGVAGDAAPDKTLKRATRKVAQKAGWPVAAAGGYPSGRSTAEERMRAWTVDADDIRVAEDFDESLLHRTPEIDAFLTPGSRRQVHRHRHQGVRQDAAAQGQAHPLPARGPGGLPADRQPPRQADRRQDLRPRGDRSSSPRRRCRGRRCGSRRSRWRRSSSVGAVDGLAGRPAPDRPDRRRPQLHSVIDHFVRLLDFTPSELQRCATETDGHLVPRLRALKAPLAIFIDGIDEYFNKHVEDRPAQPERHRRAVAQRLVLRPARAGRGRLPAAPHQPSPEGLRGDPQGGVRAAAAAHGHGRSSTAAARSTSSIRRRACARSSSTTSAS